jgi:galactokinase
MFLGDFDQSRARIWTANMHSQGARGQLALDQSCHSTRKRLLIGGCHPSQDIATFTAKCEKYVGTESGGMDQAISLMGQTGVAKMIDFNPVRSPPLATFF